MSDDKEVFEEELERKRALPPPPPPPPEEEIEGKTDLPPPPPPPEEEEIIKPEETETPADEPKQPEDDEDFIDESKTKSSAPAPPLLPIPDKPIVKPTPIPSMLKTSQPKRPIAIKTFDKPTKKEPKPRSSTTSTTSPTQPTKRRKTDPGDEEEAYLKFECMELNKEGGEKRRFARFVKVLPSILGRENSAKTADSFIPLSSSQLIGNEHAKLSFNNDTGYFELTMLGKNGALVRGEKFEGVQGLEAGVPIPLRPKDPIKIGDVCMYVCMPETEKPKKSYADLSIEALEAQKIHGILQLTSREIAQFLIDKHPYFNVNYGNVEKLTILAKSCQSAISKCEKIVSVPSGTRGRVSYQLGTKVIVPKEKKEKPAPTSSANTPAPGEASSPISPQSPEAT